MSYYSDYSLRQLLELALRVPEVGAVDFNILYYVLKTVIKEMGLEGVKPVVSLETLSKGTDETLTEEYKEKSSLSEEAGVKKSYPVEPLPSSTRKKTIKDDTIESKADDETESAGWDTINFSKRVLAVEKEISEIHSLIAQFIDRIANFESVLKQQEVKFLKEITDIKRSMLNSKKEDQSFVKKLEELSSDVSMLKRKDINYDEEDKDEKEMAEHSRQPFSEKLETVFRELDSIKKHLEKESSYDASKVTEKTPEKRRPQTKDKAAQSETSGTEVEVLNISLAVNKLMEKSSAIDKKLKSELGTLHEKIDMLEKTTTQCDEDMRYFQTNWNETLISFEYMKENLQSIEKQMSVLTEFPGLRHRVGKLEGYIYSGQQPQYEEGGEKRHSFTTAPPSAIAPADQLISKADKVLEKISFPDKKKVEPLKPAVKKLDKKQAKDLEDVIDVDKSSDIPLDKKFKAYARNVVLIQDMEKRKQISEFEASDFFKTFDEEDDDYMFEEPVYEETKKPAVDYSLAISETSTSKEVPVEYSPAEIKSSTYTSPDVLIEHSRQLKGQVIVFVKKRLHIFELDLQRIEGSLATAVKKVENLGKSMKELGDKFNFLDAIFNQRFTDFSALKDKTENHHLSIVTIMHQLDRKAEAYAVHQKVSKKELTVIEDRMLKLCRTTSSEITKLEEKINDSLKDFNLELGKMLLIKEFQIHLEAILHKIKLLEKKLKEMPIEVPFLESESIRPIEVKKYVLAKDGTRVQQTRRKMTNECIFPLLIQNMAHRQVSPKTALQVQKELESASIRESKRYVQGAYTKIKVGRKD